MRRLWKLGKCNIGVLKEGVMQVIGIEFDSNKMNYVVIEQNDTGFNVLSANRLVLGDTRSREALVAFQDAVRTLFNSAMPDLIGIKEKPETGRLKAGAAALKMEGIAVANAPCTVDFVSGARINRTDVADDSLFGYLQPALKAAAAASARNGN